MGTLEPEVRQDGVPVQPEGIALTRVILHFDLVAKIEFEKLDREEIALARLGGELAQGMGVARARHAKIDLGQQRHMWTHQVHERSHAPTSFRRSALKDAKVRRAGHGAT